MKKLVAIMILAGFTLAVTSCSSYTCATYSKAPKAQKEVKI